MSGFENSGTYLPLLPDSVTLAPGGGTTTPVVVVSMPEVIVVVDFAGGVADTVVKVTGVTVTVGSHEDVSQSPPAATTAAKMRTALTRCISEDLSERRSN